MFLLCSYFTIVRSSCVDNGEHMFSSLSIRIETTEATKKKNVMQMTGKAFDRHFS